MNFGDVVRMTNWTHHQLDLQVSYKADKKAVAVFLLLGSEPRDETNPLDLEAAMNRLGWIRAPHSPQLDDKP